MFSLRKGCCFQLEAGGNDNVIWNILYIQSECGGIFLKILSAPHYNIVMDMNDVMGREWL